MQESTLTCPPTAPAGLKYCRGYRTRFWIRPESMSFRRLFAVQFNSMTDGVRRHGKPVAGYLGGFDFNWHDATHVRKLLVHAGPGKRSLELFGTLMDYGGDQWLLCNQPDVTTAITCHDAEYVAHRCLHSRSIKDSTGVYFITNGRNAIKVGKSSTCIDKRFMALQIANPDDLRVLAVIIDPSPEAIEKRLHSMLESKRIRGEWFAMSDEEAVAIAIENGGRAISVLPY